MTILPDTPPPPGAPIFRAQDGVAVSYMPGHDLAEVELAVAGQRLACTAAQARELAGLLVAALTDPLVGTYLVARRVAALGERGGDRVA